MNFELSDDQRLMVENVSSFARKRSPVTRLRALRDDPVGYSKEVWRELGELGWLAMLFPEEVGGLGMRFIDVALLLQELGTTLVPEPYVPAMILGGQTVLRAGNQEQRERWLPSLLDGTATLALAWAEAQSRFNVADVETRAEAHGTGYRLNGDKRFVLNGHAAETLVVSARTSGASRDREGVSLFMVERDAPGVSIQTVKTMDGHKAAMISLRDVEVGADRLLGEAGQAAPVLETVMDLGAAAACAEGVGIMQTVLTMTRDYLNQREQFGVKIGTFQALQHRMVDMFVETELAKGNAIMAALKVWEEDSGLEGQKAVSIAKAHMGVGGKYVTQQAIQLHGGIGVTDEHDVGLYFKRMHILNTLYGDEEFHVGRYASLPGFEG